LEKKKKKEKKRKEKEWSCNIENHRISGSCDYGVPIIKYGKTHDVIVGN
jgi:hypothetical protein